jgi:hypothetical protein
VKFIISTQLGLSTDKLCFKRVHGLGNPIKGRIRPIVAEFSFYEDRDIFMLYFFTGEMQVMG